MFRLLLYPIKTSGLRQTNRESPERGERERRMDAVKCVEKEELAAPFVGDEPSLISTKGGTCAAVLDYMFHYLTFVT